MRIMMVCLGNICRSPIAEGIMKHLIDKEGLEWEVASCGTSGFHVGELPHNDSIKVMKENGIDISSQRSAQLSIQDFDYYDLLVTMDASNYNNVLSLCPNDEKKYKVKLLLNFAHPGENRTVPDPYYKGGFDKVYDMIFEACEKIIEYYEN